MTFSLNSRASPTRIPAVWAIPSTIKLCGTIGNAGYRSCRCSSASDTFFTAVADVRDVNSVNLSIQIQRISNAIVLRMRTWSIRGNFRRRCGSLRLLDEVLELHARLRVAAGLEI